jgi:hypothetical protein
MSESTIVEQLALVEPDWAEVRRRSERLHTRSVVRRAVLSAGVVAAAAALAAGAYAAAHAIWGGQDMTPADIGRQATTVDNHKEVTVLPSMGVVFVLPDGDSTPVIPAEAVWNIPATGGPTPTGQPARDDSGNSWGTAHPLQDASGRWVGGVWQVPLPNGGERTITWRQASGAVAVTDRDSQGDVTATTDLHTGDVVPLIPGTLTDAPRTLEKAVTFDLPTSNRVIIFPQLNETYVDFVHGPTMSEPLPYDAAAKYGLTPIGHYDGELPVIPSGGTWTAHLPDGLTRTIGWHAGDSFVTVEDTTSSGTTTTRVPIGHELPLVPFK